MYIIIDIKNTDRGSLREFSNYSKFSKYMINYRHSGHFGLFKPPTLRLGEAGTTQTQSQTPRLRIAKTDFKSVRKTIYTKLPTKMSNSRGVNIISF